MQVKKFFSLLDAVRFCRDNRISWKRAKKRGLYLWEVKL